MSTLLFLAYCGLITIAHGCSADSEHSAIFQCIQGLPEGGLRRIILTASGGAFRDWPVEKLKTVKVADALKHPNWSMGRKITVDSATLMNKGLEVIEAHYLFGVDYDNIDIVIHPQSIIHSMVETQDSSVLAQVSAQVSRSNSMPFSKLPYATTSDCISLMYHVQYILMGSKLSPMSFCYLVPCVLIYWYAS